MPAPYEADGQTKEIVYDNGVRTVFFYSPTRRWLYRMITYAPSGGKMMDNIYARDLAGRITSIDGLAASGDWTYAYNNLDYLIEAENAGTPSLSETFAYSLSGNLVLRTRGGYVFRRGEDLHQKSYSHPRNPFHNASSERRRRWIGRRRARQIGTC